MNRRGDVENSAPYARGTASAQIKVYDMVYLLQYIVLSQEGSMERRGIIGGGGIGLSASGEAKAIRCE